MTAAMLLGLLLAGACILALAWKWELGLLRVAIGVLLVGALVVLGTAALTSSVELPPWLEAAIVFLGTILVSGAVLAYRFYRDPERTPPTMPGAIVSPADGLVIYVHRVDAGVIPDGTKRGHPHRLEELTGTALESDAASVIGIAMSFLDVHINRAPIAGRVALLRHVPGRFASLKDRDKVFENERRTTVIRQPGMEVAVVQIASRLVRRIVPFVDAGQEVGLGARIGVIRLGSQVDVVIPASASVKVRAGDRVRAGESVIATASQPPTDG